MTRKVLFHGVVSQSYPYFNKQTKDWTGSKLKIIFWIWAMQRLQFELRQNQQYYWYMRTRTLCCMHQHFFKINLPSNISQIWRKSVRLSINVSINVKVKSIEVHPLVQTGKFPLCKSVCNYYLKSFCWRNHFPSLLRYFSWIF